MAILVGLCLIPAGALIGTLVVLLMTLFDTGGLPPAGAVDALFRVGLGFGLVFAAPVCAVVLPLSHALLRRRDALGMPRFAMIGCLSGIVPVWAFALLEAQRTGDLHVADGGVWALSAVAAFAGLAVSLAFAYLMRKLRPLDWTGRSLGADA